MSSIRSCSRYQRVPSRTSTRWKTDERLNGVVIDSRSHRPNGSSALQTDSAADQRRICPVSQGFRPNCSVTPEIREYPMSFLEGAKQSLQFFMPPPVARILQGRSSIISFWLAVWLSGNALVSINVVPLRQTRLVPGWVTVCGRVNHLGM